MLKQVEKPALLPDCPLAVALSLTESDVSRLEAAKNAGLNTLKEVEEIASLVNLFDLSECVQACILGSF